MSVAIAIVIPSADVARCYDSFARSPEQAGQIESFIARCLQALAKLNDDDVGHGVAILWEEFSIKMIKIKSRKYFFN